MQMHSQTGTHQADWWLDPWVGVQRPSDHWNLRWIQIPLENKCDVCSAASIICVTPSQTPHQPIWNN